MSREITGRPIKVSIVGCGRIAENHFKSVAAHGADMQLVSICDADPRVMEAVARKYSVPGFISLTDMLAGSDPDLVVLCTPSGLHSQQAIQAARAGRHVMTEKPMATRWHDGLAMVRECDRLCTT